MIVIATLPALVALIGLIGWFMVPNPKVAEACKLAFFAGLFVFLLLSGGKGIKF